MKRSQTAVSASRRCNLTAVCQPPSHSITRIIIMKAGTSLRPASQPILLMKRQRVLQLKVSPSLANRCNAQLLMLYLNLETWKEIGGG
jgi:hypothetical protein